MLSLSGLQLPCLPVKLASCLHPIASRSVPRSGTSHACTALTGGPAQVFVSGSETTGEFRAQLYTPDYLQNGKPRPLISGAPDVVGYDKQFSFKYSNVTSVDRVVFHRLTGACHPQPG